MTAPTPDPLRRFLARAADPARPRVPIRAELPARATGDGTVTLRLYDPIDSWGGPWGVSAKEVAAVLDELGEDVTELRVLINSPGGEATEGIAIMNLLRNHPARVVAIVEGVAASAASFIAVSADETLMCPNSELMIHEAWGFAFGPAEVMEDAARLLNHISSNMATIYQAKAGGTVEDWRAVQKAETWYTPEEALAAGLVDRVTGTPAGDQAGEAAAAAAQARFDLSIFTYAGRANAPAPMLPAASASGSTTRTGSDHQEGSDVVAFSPEQLTALRNKLGVAENADEATILAAVDEALTERAEAPAAPQAAIPEGTVLVDSAQLAELRADATAGRQARTQQETERREGLVAAAVREGRIPPARRDAWLAMLEADPDSEQTLAALAPGLVPLSELGHAGEPDTGVTEDDAVFAALFGTERKGA